MNNIREYINKAKKSNKKIFIRGMGYYGKTLSAFFDYEEISFEGFIDPDPEKQSAGNIAGHKCYAPSAADSDSFVFIAIHSDIAIKSISEELTAAGIEFTTVSMEDIISFSDGIDDKSFLQVFFKVLFNYPLNLENPQTFCEKLNWLKLYDHNPLYNKLADKYEVKKFVSDVIGSEYVVENYGVWDSFDDIDFDALPDSFILKCTHNSGYSYVVKDKNSFDIEKASKILNEGMNNNYYYYCREWVYKDIKPRILADKLLDDKTLERRSGSMCDYKFWCFNGVPMYMYHTVKDNDIFENFYDMEHNVVNIDHGFPRLVPEFEKPAEFEKMKEIVGKLAKASEASFVRVDLFDVSGQLYFGEFTFYDWAGLRPFSTYEQDLMLGKLIDLPQNN